MRIDSSLLRTGSYGTWDRVVETHLSPWNIRQGGSDTPVSWAELQTRKYQRWANNSREVTLSRNVSQFGLTCLPCIDILCKVCSLHYRLVKWLKYWNTSLNVVIFYTEREEGRQTETDRNIHRQTQKEREREGINSRQADRQIDWQTDREREREISASSPSALYPLSIVCLPCLPRPLPRQRRWYAGW